MFEVQEIEVTPCNQSQGKLYISLLFEEETHRKHNSETRLAGNLLWLLVESKLGLGSIYNWRRKCS